MANYDLTEEAEAHVAEIYRHSVRAFGRKVGRRYLSALHRKFALLAESPQIGTEQVWIRAGYRRLVHEEHVIYYRAAPDGIVIVAVLHHARDPARYFVN